MVAQLVRASACHAEGRGFKSLSLRHENPSFEGFSYAKVIHLRNRSLFDIVIIAAKDDGSGQVSKRTIKNVQLMNKGSSIGMRNIDIQEKYDFLATDITPLVKV